MVEIELSKSAKTKKHFNDHLNKIKDIADSGYQIKDTRIDDINQRLFMNVDLVYTETKKKWFSKKTYTVNKSKRICWMCYQDDYGIYIYPNSMNESVELANLLENNGYSVRIIVEDEKYLSK